ncbi:hypothetical protein BKA64DRAFT_773287 [Cadophora sp. MPI-SDFR-AT-0126]|nr:hypothetical protein BKA64DRAFT_773287 [Leotiomycetes sp. MPI-SDFR-AT-0126]
MKTNPADNSRFETLPSEISHLSRISKSVKEACIPCIFHSVEILFSTDGFNGLKSLIKSDTRYHIISFTYVIPELLKPKILDFSCFQSQLLTPDNYRSIIDNGVDLSVLCLTFGALPRLTEVGLSSCEAIEDNLSPSPFTAGMTTAEDSYKYHLRVVSNTIQSSRNRGAAINTISLSEFDLPYYHVWEVLDLSTLSESLRKLLYSPLELLSRCALDIYQLNICYMIVKHNAL